MFFWRLSCEVLLLNNASLEGDGVHVYSWEEDACWLWERFVSGSDSTGAEEGVMLSTFSVTSTSVCDSLLKNFQKIIWKGKGR